MEKIRSRTSVLYCTYCSARKKRRPFLLPAVRRYMSPRIRAVHRASRRRRARFAILSGKFGLIGPYKKIPYYDHLLGANEVAGLPPQMVAYLKRKAVRSVRFFHDPVRANPRVKPYLSAIRRACRRAGVRLSMVEIQA